MQKNPINLISSTQYPNFIFGFLRSNIISQNVLDLIPTSQVEIFREKN